MRILNLAIMMVMAFVVFTYKLRQAYPPNKSGNKSTISGSPSQTFFPESSMPLAMNGYDVVTMVKEKTARKGSMEHQYTWQDEIWLFENQDNRRAFTYNLNKYAPQFEGLSVFWVARNQAVPGSDEFWSVYDGKLYVNDNRESHQNWLDNQEATLMYAERNWVNISKNLR